MCHNSIHHLIHVVVQDLRQTIFASAHSSSLQFDIVFCRAGSTRLLETCNEQEHTGEHSEIAMWILALPPPFTNLLDFNNLVTHKE
ncbi:hypothetical protein CY34DRAFT_523792 [Suillus luteus UH-Slu-Lm8-n1]|uniref:Uncharacterized protein n=1 Tax=Suillus luteus UH-Slu-Lm8-n1 TaxID=930992 RepID=A0A0D0BHK1_9AGAM|nr:hypothetical protein CY34DRAFT_523792 [Suillus luteus UH-Slu-Lm8-n1]